MGEHMNHTQKCAFFHDRIQHSSVIHLNEPVHQNHSKERDSKGRGIGYANQYYLTTHIIYIFLILQHSPFAGTYGMYMYV